MKYSKNSNYINEILNHKNILLFFLKRYNRIIIIHILVMY